MSLHSIFGVHEQALQLRAQRAEVLASNLANADTPGFQARDYDFKEVLSNLNSQSADNLVTTNPRHMGSEQELMSPTLMYSVPLQTRLDGNTVDTQVETAKFAENSMKYLASLRFLDAKLDHFTQRLGVNNYVVLRNI